LLLVSAAPWPGGRAAAEPIRIGGTGGALGAMRMLGEAFRKHEPATPVVIFPTLGSGGGIKAVLTGNLDLGVSARPLTAEERALGAREEVFGKTAMVFAVAKISPVSGVTTREVTDIYSGTMTAWPDGDTIRLVLRPPDDTDIRQLIAKSPGMKRAVEAALARKGMISALTDQEAANYLEKVSGAFGTTVLSLIIAEKRPLRALALDGVEPNVKALSDGKWPLVRVFVLVTGAGSSPATKRFVHFLRSTEGRRVLLQAGCVAVR
jgi:phosphate transport system substrate-binding protein